MVDAATQFRKNGFNDEDAAQLAVVASKFQNIADDQISAGDAASFIISQLIAFNKTADDSTHVIDALNEVSNNFSVSTTDLSKGLSVVASTSASMGNSMEQTIGMMTAITEQTRNASRASRGLNQIFSRLSQVTSDTSSTGKALTSIYNQLGIELYDTQGQLRSSYDILLDLSKIWNTLDTNTQNYIALTSSGSNQLNNFLALMNNFQHAVDATGTALESTGSAERENSRYMESLTAHITALKAAFQDLSRAVLESDFLRVLLDGLTKLVQLLADNPAIVQMALISAGITSIGALAKNFLPILTALTAGFGGAGVAAAGAAGGVGTLAVSLASIAPYAVAAGVVITALIAGVKAWKALHPDLETMNETLTANKKRLEELNNLPLSSRTSEINAEIESLKKENAELEKNISLKSKRKAERQYGEGAISQQFGGDTYSVVADGIKYEAATLDQLKDKLREANVITYDYVGNLEELGVQQSSTTDKIKDAITSVNAHNNAIAMGKELSADEIKSWSEQTSSLQDFVNMVNNAVDAGVDLDSQYITLANQAQTVIDKTTELNSKLVENSDVMDRLASGVSITTDEYNSLIAVYPELQSYIDVVSGSVEQQNALWGLNVNALADAAAQGDAWAIAMINDTMQVANAIDVINRALSQAAGTYIDKTTGITSGYSPYAPQMKEKESDLLSQLEKLKASADAGSKLLKNGNKIGLTGGGGSGSGSKATSASKKQADTEDKRLETLKSIVSLRSTEAELTEEQTDDTDTLIAKYKSVQDALHDQANYMRSVLERMKKQGASEQEINEYQESIVSLSKEWYSWEDKITTALEKQVEARKEARKAELNAQKDAISAQQDELDLIAAYAQHIADQEIEKLNEQIDAIDAVNDALDEQIKKQELLDALSAAKQKKLYVYKDGRFQYVEDVDAISEAQKNLDEYEREQTVKEQKAALEAEKKRWEEYKTGWTDLTNTYDYQQGELLYMQKYGAKVEQENWETRLKNLDAFVKEYKDKLNELNQLENALEGIDAGDVTGSAAMGGAGGGSYTGSMSATLPNGQKTSVRYENGKLVSNVPAGTIIHTAGGDFVYPGASGSTSSGGSSSKSSSSSSSSSGNYQAGSSSGKTYNIGSSKGKDFVDNAKPGSSMKGGDGSTWTKDTSGKVTITDKNGTSYVVRGYALGTTGAVGGISMVGENGPELRVLGQGDGILPANITRNLWDWGKMKPSDMTRSLSNVFNISNLTLPNARDAQSLVTGLKQMAYQRAYKRA